MKDKIKRYFSDIWNSKNKRITMLIYVISPFICALIIDCFNKRNAWSALKSLVQSPYTYLINVMIIMFTMSLGLLCRKRLAFAASVIALWLGLGIANFVIMSMRVSPFSATDLKLIGKIDNIIEVYLTPVTLILIIVAIVLVVLLVAVLWVKLPKYVEKISYLKNIVIVTITFFAMMATINVGLLTGKVSEKFPNMTIAYYNYGFPFCFSSSVFNTGVSQPEEYTENSVSEILEKMEATSVVDKDNVMTPNVIFLQLESFIDLNKFEDLKLSTEATPVFNSLKEKYPSGYLKVNNVGYGTANTEFEIMTGLNLDDFGPGEFPYNTILTKTTCESTAYILKEYGYTTHVMHNNTATFYSRNSVFKRLGFDTFTSIEYMNGLEYTPTNWAKDMVFVDEIVKALDSTEDVDYIYTISVQGHGAYPTESVIEEPVVEIISGIEDESRKYMFEYYANMIYEMDKFVGELINRLSDYGEDIVLVMYGDHLPGLDITEDELINGDLYQTEYIVWNNMNLDMEDKDIETFQLSSRVLQHLNIDKGYINKFHQTFGERSDYFEKLHVLSYDILYGKMFAYGGINPYVATDMKMGTADLVIKSVAQATVKEMDTYIPGWRQGILNNDEVKDNTDKDNTDKDNTDKDNTDKDNIDKDNDTNGDDSNNGNDGGNENSNNNEEGSSESGNKDETQQPEKPEAELAEGWYIIKGINFTKASRVSINDDEYETIFVDEETLIIKSENIEALDVFVVKQKAGIVTLSSSHEFTYFVINE